MNQLCACYCFFGSGTTVAPALTIVANASGKTANLYKLLVKIVAAIFDLYPEAQCTRYSWSFGSFPALI
jgi:hypothetical protein